MDAGRPPGHPALPLRASDRPGLLTWRGSRPWGLYEAVLGFAAGLVVSLVFAGIAEAATGYHASKGAPYPVAVIAANVAGLWVGLVGAAVYASRRHGSGSLSRDYGFRVGAWWDLPAGAAVGLASQYLLIPLLYLPFGTFDKQIDQQLSRPVHQDTGSVHTVAAASVVMLFLAVGAPLVEELFFRGLLLRSLLSRAPAPAAIVVSAVLFALAHFEAVQFFGLAVFGVVLGVLAWRTGRLAPSVGAHMAFNAAAVVAVVRLH